MDSEIYESIEQLLFLKRMEAVENLNMTALATSAGQGSKEAVKAIKSINREQEDMAREEERKGQVGKLVSPRLTDDQIGDIFRRK